VHVLDDLSTGSIENIGHLKHHPRFEYTLDSASNHHVVAELVDEADIVVHLAAAVGVQLVVSSPVRVIETNLHCTEVVLAHASKKRKPVLIASTSEVYGKSQALPFREDGDMQMGAPDKGRWAYACSWQWRTGASALCRPRSCACSTRWDRDRREAMGWWCPGS
jgi:UDP-glucose 4-epimerase